MHGVTSVTQWQLVQEAPDLFTMWVVPAKGYTSAENKQILKNLSHDLPGVKIVIKTTNAIMQNPGGKRALYRSMLNSSCPESLP
jgi:hypothetical protein